MEIDNHFIKEHAYIVVRTIARQYGKVNYYQDLMQEGNIRQPMALQSLGKVLTCHSFMPLKTTGGKRGYLVLNALS